MVDEIYQVQHLEDSSIDSLSTLIEELNIRLRDISQRLHNPARYVSRVGIDKDDFTLTDFVTDGEWHILDLSDILPDNAQLAVLYLHLEDNLAGSFFEVRSGDEENSKNVFESHTTSAGNAIDNEGTVDVSNLKYVEYKATDTTFTEIKLTIRGYWTW